MRTVLVVLVVVTSLVAPATVAAANEAPLADAGLDQSVPAGTTVYLDATGSRDPDGSVVGYEWVIEAPNGSTVLPEGFTDPRTSFVPARTGRYEVTVIVTDSEGVSARDTLYVDVGSAPDGPDTPDGPDDGTETPTEPPDSEPPTDLPGGDPPTTPSPGVTVPDVPAGDCPGGGCSDARLTAEIVGPSTVPADATATFVVRASDPDGSIVSREWATLGKRNDVSSGGSTGSGKRIQKSFSKDDVGRTVQLTVTVRNEDGDSVTASKQVAVVSTDREGVINLVGPSEIDEDVTNTWSVRVYNAEVQRYRWTIADTTGPVVSKSWNIPNPKREQRLEIVGVTVVLANGSQIYKSKIVTVQQVQRGKKAEIDQTNRGGIEGIFREVRERLAGERRQEEVGPGSYYIETESGEMERADWVNPDTTMVDDYDPGALDVVSAGLDDLSNRSSRAGNQLNSQITSGGVALESQFDRTASGVRDTTGKVGSGVNQSLVGSGVAGNEAITSAGNQAGGTVGGLVETGIETSVLSEDNGPAGVGLSDRQAAEVGSTFEQGIRGTADGVGNTYERGTRALGEGSVALSRAGGNAVGSFLETGGDLARTGSDFVGDRVEDASNAGSAVPGFLSDVASGADDYINEKLPGDDGEDTEAGESDTVSVGDGRFSR